MWYELVDGKLKKLPPNTFPSNIPANKFQLIDIVDGVKISTVFLGLDHNLSGNGPPKVFETMVFGGKYDSYQERYSSLFKATIGHKRTVFKVAGGLSGIFKRL